MPNKSLYIYSGLYEITTFGLSKQHGSDKFTLLRIMIQVITTFYGVFCVLPQTIQILCQDNCVVEFASVVGYSILLNSLIP